MPAHKTPAKFRLWPKVQIGKPDDCWPWTGGTDHHGYGKIWSFPKPVHAHRVAYESATGPIPTGMLVCHTCDNPPCCNPAHLFLGTAQDNATDCKRKGRTTKGKKPFSAIHPELMPRGEQHSQAKLTEHAVKEIRQAVHIGIPMKILGQVFGVTAANISIITKRRSWKHVG